MGNENIDKNDFMALSQDMASKDIEQLKLFDVLNDLIEEGKEIPQEMIDRFNPNT